MTSEGMENKSEGGATTSDNQQTPQMTSVPIYNASSSHHHGHTCNDPSHHHHHHHPMFFDQVDESSASRTGRNTASKQRKAKKSQNQDVTLAEFIPGHRGDSNIDDLMNFINGPTSTNNAGNSKKSKNKSNTTS